jgi:hypothetical protein
MPDVHKGTQPTGLIAWHLGVGAVLIAVMTIRITWRITHRPPPDTLAPLLSAVSKITHLLLYVALIAVPLLGCANASSRGWAVSFLGTVRYPNLTPVGSSLGHAMGDIQGRAGMGVVRPDCHACRSSVFPPLCSRGSGSATYDTVKQCRSGSRLSLSHRMRTS